MNQSEPGDEMPACIKIRKDITLTSFFGYWLSGEALSQEAMDLDLFNGERQDLIPFHKRLLPPLEQWQDLSFHERQLYFEAYNQWIPNYYEEIDVQTYDTMAGYGLDMDGLDFLVLPPDCTGVVIISLPFDDYMRFYPKFSSLNYEGLLDNLTFGQLRKEIRDKAKYMATLAQYSLEDDFFERHHSKIRMNFFPITHQDIYKELFAATSLAYKQEEGFYEEENREGNPKKRNLLSSSYTGTNKKRRSRFC